MMDKLRLWAWYFALVVSAVLVLVSFYSGENFIFVVLSGIIGFTLIYGICMASIIMFEKTGIEMERIEPGNLLDIAVGQEDNLKFGGEGSEGGQIPTARAGQLNQEFAEGEPSVEKQAEMVRRMGWGD